MQWPPARNQSAGSYEKYADAVRGNADYYIKWMANSQKTMCSYNAVIPSVLLSVLPGGMALWLSGSLETMTFMAAVIFSLGLAWTCGANHGGFFFHRLFGYAGKKYRGNRQYLKC